MHGFGFDRYTARYLVRLKDAGATTLMPSVSPKGAWTMSIFTSDWFGLTSRMPGQVWPFIGGNVAAHSVELFGYKDIIWGGTVTHNSNGITGDNTTGYGNLGSSTDFFPNPNGWCFGIYSRTNSSADNVYEIGSGVGSNKYAIASRSAAGNLHVYPGNATALSAAITNSLGLIWIIRRNSTAASFSAYSMRNTSVITSTSNAASGVPGAAFTICAANGLGFSNRNISFAFITPFHAVDQNVCYPKIQNLQTFLGRQV